MPLTITAGQVRDMATLDEAEIARSVDSILSEIEKEILEAAHRKVTEITWMRYPFNVPVHNALAKDNRIYVEVRKRVEESLKAAGFILSYDTGTTGTTINWR